jgi:hypothetical protein
MPRLWTGSLAAACAALATIASVSVAVGADAESSAVRGCVPAPGQLEAVAAKNVEAIIDDSDSMRLSDPFRLRVAGLELFITAPENKRKTIGVVEFGSNANTVFPPLPVRGNRDQMVNQLSRFVNADNGGTNYDAGFLTGRQDNPNAEARIFVTDGVPKDGFNDTHRPGPRTFVVGIGIGSPGPGNPNANRLQRIADETGGVYFPGVGRETIQPTYKTIGSAINCLSPPRRFRSRRFTKPGQKSTRTVRLARGTKKIELAVTWAHPRNRFRLTRVDLMGRKKKVLRNLTRKGRPWLLRRTSRNTKTSRTLRFKKPRKAKKLRFTITAKRIYRPGRTITLLTEREE